MNAYGTGGNMNNKVLKSSLQVTAIVFLVKILGLLKQSIVAMICGATYETDLFFLATGLVTQLCVVIFSSISISLLSLYFDSTAKKDYEYATSVISSVLKVIIPICFVMSVFTCVLAPIFAKVLAPSYNAEQAKELATIIRILSILFVLNAYYLIINVTLEAQKNLLPGKILNLLQNLFTIVFVVFVYKKYGVISLVYGMVFANVVGCIYITIRASKFYAFGFRQLFRWSEVKQLLRLSFPLLIGNAMYEISDIIDKQIASQLGNGVVSYLAYGTSINEIISSLIGTTVSSVLFVHYAAWVSEGRKDLISSELGKSIRVLVFILLPITVVGIVSRYDIVKILYGRGSFGEYDIFCTSGVVLGYAVGFVFQALRANLVKVFYSLKDTRTPMINGIICITVNIIVSIALSRVIGISGVAFGTSIAMILATALLLINLKYRLMDFSISSDLKNFIKQFMAFIVSFAFAQIFQSAMIPMSFIRLALVSGCAIITYIVVCTITKEETTIYYVDLIKKRIVR